MITPIPQLPEAIIEAVNRGKLAVFLGAGVSRLVGCSGWQDLARKLVNRCYDDNIINYKEKETLSANSDHKKTITIAYHLLNSKSKKNIFFEEMKAALKEGKDILIPNIYDEIRQLRGLFITTNADTHFDRFFNEPNKIFREEDFDAETIDKVNLYHIHGSILNEDSLVFTLRHYFRRYNAPNFVKFLKKIFDEYTVLFLGYGLAEFELIDFLFSKYDKKTKKDLRHFILHPFYSGEDNILEFEQAYYNELGITVLAYEKDKRGYDQLIDVIKAWNKEINQLSTITPDTYKLIEDIVR
jgi:hypothetical protein